MHGVDELVALLPCNLVVDVDLKPMDLPQSVVLNDFHGGDGDPSHGPCYSYRSPWWLFC